MATWASATERRKRSGQGATTTLSFRHGLDGPAQRGQPAEAEHPGADTSLCASALNSAPDPEAGPRLRVRPESGRRDGGARSSRLACPVSWRVRRVRRDRERARR